MKSYAKELSETLKKAGRDCVQSKKPDRIERLVAKLAELEKEAVLTNIVWTWMEAAALLGVDETKRLLLCVLWGYQAEMKRELACAEFWQLFEELSDQFPDMDEELPDWIYESEARVMLSPVVFDWLEGRTPMLPEGVELSFPTPEVRYGLGNIFEDCEKLFLAADVDAAPRILCIEGEKGSGRTFCIEQICADRGMALLMLDGDRFSGNARQLRACVHAAVLYGAFVCVRLGKEVRERLLEELCAGFRFYAILQDEKRPMEEQPPAVIYTRRLTRPEKSLKTAIAKELLAEWQDELSVASRLQQITGRQLPMGAYLRYVRTICAELELGTLRAEHIQVPSSSSSLNFLPSTRNFSELKLPKAQYEQLQRISRMIAAREDVLSGWGFGHKFNYGNGMSVLFYGAPGTGKTMAAQVLANALGMPLYRVDLSQLISKYIGETQKNIGKIFDEAEKCDCILLFDEADAIFTKRSDVSDAQDRYSNAETAYLLQRIEAYSGVSILATNLLQNFDEAFRRRISYMVHFPMPDVSLRRELWESIFPKETPIRADVDALTLAQAFELSGASIKNAALHGALYARAEGCDVGMRHILDGIRNEYAKQGKSFGSTQKELLDAYQ